MTQETIFNQGQTPDQTKDAVANASTSQNNDSFADLLGSIKNEKGEPKYRDLPTALDALKHSQEFIPQIRQENDALKRELEELRNQVSKLSEVEQTVQRLTSQQKPNESQAPQGLDEKTVADLVTRTLSQREEQAVQKANVQAVVNAMKNSLGDDAEKLFYSKAAELGMAPAQINQLAAQTPQAVLKLFGLEPTKPQAKVVSPTSGSLNTTGYQQQPESFVKKNDKPVLIGATTEEQIMEVRSSRSLVDELHNQGLSTYDLTDPKAYFKYFK